MADRFSEDIEMMRGDFSFLSDFELREIGHVSNAVSARGGRYSEIKFKNEYVVVFIELYRSAISKLIGYTVIIKQISGEKNFSVRDYVNHRKISSPSDVYDNVESYSEEYAYFLRSLIESDLRPIIEQGQWREIPFFWGKYK